MNDNLGYRSGCDPQREGAECRSEGMEKELCKGMSAGERGAELKLTVYPSRHFYYPYTYILQT